MIYVTEQGFKVITSIGVSSLELRELPSRYEIIGEGNALKAIKEWFNIAGVTALCSEGNIEILYIPKGDKRFKLVSNIADLA